VLREQLKAAGYVMSRVPATSEKNITMPLDDKPLYYFGASFVFCMASLNSLGIVDNEHRKVE
jgi:hypothetical protein